MGFFSPGFFQRLAKAMIEQSETVPCAEVANHFLERAHQEGRALTAMQMTHLLYLAHGWHLAYFYKPLLRETFVAHRLGLRTLGFHRQLAQSGTAGIQGLFGSGPRPCDLPRLPALPHESMALLDQVWVSHARYSGATLARMCTQPDNPWAQAWDGKAEAWLSDASLQAHFEKKREQHTSRATAA